MILMILIVLHLNPNKNNRSNNVQIMAALQYLSNFWRTLKILWRTLEINIFLTWSEECTIVTGDYDNKKNKICNS